MHHEYSFLLNLIFLEIYSLQSQADKQLIFTYLMGAIRLHHWGWWGDREVFSDLLK